MNIHTFVLFFDVAIICIVVPAFDVGNECDTVCHGGPFDVCKKCASICPKTCDNYNEGYVCLDACKSDTCECSEPTVKNVKTGQCVLTMECPEVTDY